MERFQISTPKPYDIVIGSGILSQTGAMMKQVLPPCKICIISDTNVNSLYSQTLISSLLEAGYQICRVVFPAGEHSKNLHTFTNILEALAEEGLTRSDGILALGGGVVGDVAGFAASTYLRGIPYIQVPTTYLAAIDSSIGGKTAVNLRSGKNLAGTYWQPSLVVCDYRTFDTLPKEYMLDGLAEALKTAVISDAHLSDKILEGDYEFVIKRCVSIKRSIIEVDERDVGMRQLLNLGHTIGHGIEKLSSYNVTHGRAVAQGMLVETRGAYRCNMTDIDLSPILTEQLTALGFSTDIPYSAKELFHYAQTDKKIYNGSINMVVPESYGKCRLQKMSLSQLENIIKLGLKP